MSAIPQQANPEMARLRFDLMVDFVSGGKLRQMYKEVEVWIENKMLYLRLPWGETWQGQCDHNDLRPMRVTADKVLRSGVRLEKQRRKKDG